ncbi:MAG: helicase-related protein, partial [Myxococcota bacterium]
EVGMGKTYEALGVIGAFRKANPKARVLVLTPGPDLNKKWQKEFKACSAGADPIHRFEPVGTCGSLDDLVRESNERSTVLAPMSLFHSTRADHEQQWLLSAFGRSRRLHGRTMNALFRRFRGGRLQAIDPRQSAFLAATFDKLSPLLKGAFAEGGAGSLDALYSEHGIELWAKDEAAVRSALDLARFALARKLLPQFDLLVVDEAHKLKNPHSVRSQVLKTALRGRFQRVLFLTATPFQLGIEELREVFRLFQLATKAPKDLEEQADALLADIAEWQRTYEEFHSLWRRLDGVQASEFGATWPDLAGVDDPTLRRVAEATQRLLALKDQKVEPGLRRWMIRSVNHAKRIYRHRDVHLLDAQPRASLALLMYERLLAEVFRRGHSTHKTTAEINMVSSFGAAREGALLDAGRTDLERIERHRGTMRLILEGLKEGENLHPKIAWVVKDAVAAAEQDEKTLIFCSRTRTLHELKAAIDLAWREKVLDGWRCIRLDLDEAAVFPARDAREGRGRGLHARWQARFQRPQDVLYLALRERHIQAHPVLSAFARKNLDEIATRATRLLHQQRVSRLSAERRDWKLLKRCVEAAAAGLWVQSGRGAKGLDVGVLEALTDPRYVALGLDLVADGLEEAADESTDGHTPVWSIEPRYARLVLSRRPHLWLDPTLASLLSALPRSTRVALVERLARYLTYADVPWMSEALGHQGQGVLTMPGRKLLRALDNWWITAAGERWRKRLAEFVAYFVAQDDSGQAELLAGPLARTTFVRHTADGETRERLQVAFNAPGIYPMVLVANEVMQEGLDLHRACRRVVHHDLSWNPAPIEQRIGRVDRLGSRIAKLLEQDPGERLAVIVPLIRRTIDERIYRTVREREKWLEFLLGARPDLGALAPDEVPPAELPEALAEALRIELGPG